MKNLVTPIIFCLVFPLSAPLGLASEGKVVWDDWYILTVNKMPAEAENEKAVLLDDKVQYFNHVWKKEEGYINEEQLGAFAKADMDLTPLFFNFRSTYRTSETVIDGTVHDKNLVIKIRRGGQSLPTVTRSVPSKTFFSVFFPVWLHKVVPALKVGKTLPFSVILEDDIDHGFETEAGTVRLENEDEFAKSNHAKKLVVDLRDTKSTWYVDPVGAPLRTINAEAGTVLERVTKDKVEAFLTK